MYSNLKSDEKRRQEVISCLYWSLMQNWNIPQSMQDYFGLTEDYRLYHQLEDMDTAIYRQKRATGEIPDVLEVDARLTRAVENIFESICERPPGPYLNKLNEELEKLGDKKIRFVRLSNVFGPTCRPGYNSVIATWADAAARRKVDEIVLNPLSKEAMIPLLYVGDLAEAVVSALTHSGFANLQKGIDGLVGKVSLESVWKLFVHFATLEENRDPLLSLSSFGIPPSTLERLYGTYLFALGKPLLLIPVVHRDVRGSFSELVKGGFGGEAQVSWNTVNPFHEKGGHYHHHKIERFTFLEGGMRLFLKPVFQEGAWEGASFRTESLCSFDIPPFLAHSFRNQTNKAQGVVIWCSEPFDADDADTYAKKE